MNEKGGEADQQEEPTQGEWVLVYVHHGEGEGALEWVKVEPIE